MNKLKELNFENITVTKFNDGVFGDKISLKVMDNNEVIAEVVGAEMSLNELVSSHFYHEIVKPEFNYIFDNVLSKEDKDLVNSNNMSSKDYVEFVNHRYDEFEDELETLNNLFKTYENLIVYSSDNEDSNTYCFALDSIGAKYTKTGAGTLLINYLKEKYNLIYLYSIMEIEWYFKDKVDFKEIINGFMYWTNNENLNEII